MKNTAWSGKSGTGARKLKKRVKGIVDEMVIQLSERHGVNVDAARVKLLKARLVKASVELAAQEERA